MGEFRSFPVPGALEGQRIDSAISRLLGISRTKAAELADAGAVDIDGVSASKSHRLPPGGWLTVELPDVQAPPSPEPVPGMVIRYEDPDLLIIDKPAGVASHASPGWEGPTVVGALASAGTQVAAAGPEERQGIVHRLDVGTSGLMIVAKSNHAYSALKRAFKDREVHRRYHALVHGNLTTPEGTIDAPIARAPGAEYRFGVVSGGKPALTHYRVLESFRGATLVEVELETGRTHQIRLHMEAIGHPCIGDPMYGTGAAEAGRAGPRAAGGHPRQWLHAVEVGFAHPRTGRWQVQRSPYPRELQENLDLYVNE